VIVGNEQTRLAILGAGGMGKTSTALHIMHHQDVVARYQDRRYFIGCDAATSAESLAALILQVVRARSTAGVNILTSLHRVLLASPCTLLLLDNFETVWDTISGRDRVLDVLQKIGSAKPISLIITMRGVVPPPGIAWTRFDTLPPLSPGASKSVFLTINPLFNDGNDSDGQNLDMLLAEMDYVPLAVQLLAQVSIGSSPSYMLERWRQEKTAMLHTHEVQPGKLESIEVSISLSLAALDITNHPEAVQLLSVLCHLPDGLGQWEERLPHIAAGFQNFRHIVHLLQKTALLFIAGGRLKVLSPIRHFIRCHHPAEHNHMMHLQKYFWDLVHTYGTVPHGPGFIQARDILEPDIGNIHSLIIDAVQNHPSICVLDTVLEISGFLYRTHPSTEILLEVIPFVQKIGSPMKEAQVFQCLGETLRIQNRYADASDTLTKAQRQFIEIVHVQGVAQCSRRLGEILRMQSKHAKASEILSEAQKQFLGIGDVLGATQCLKSLGDILFMQDKYSEASDTLTQAQSQFLEISDAQGVAQCLQGIGNILRMEYKYTEATDTLMRAQTQFHEIGGTLGVAQCSQSLGEILHMQHKYAEATDALTQAQRQFLDIGFVLGAAECSQSLGVILYMQNKYIEANNTLTHAHKLFLEISNSVGAANCLEMLKNIQAIMYRQGDPRTS
jgi:tetratricopeptide (TPR) repeat protein